jgi:hypothetical protein
LEKKFKEKCNRIANSQIFTQAEGGALGRANLSCSLKKGKE